MYFYKGKGAIVPKAYRVVEVELHAFDTRCNVCGQFHAPVALPGKEPPPPPP
jgi:hypothetical protein